MKQYYKFYLLHVLLCVLFVSLQAQQGCPSVNAGPDALLPCGTNCTNLNATFFQTGGAATYSVSSIPYQPFSYTAGTPIIVNDDDVWSDVIALPFTFCFFDQPFSHLIVGANGILSFDTADALNTCDYNLVGTNPIPTNGLYTNCIMGPYHDIDPSIHGNIRYQIGGVAPCRTFVVSYSAVAMYGLFCTSTVDATHQIVLYETTNAIEIYIKDKGSCSSWNGGLAIEGIQNASGTVGYAVPGRNNTVWSAANDAWRFTPTGPSIVTVDWLQGGNVVGTGSTYQACPGQNTTYTARATYIPCSGGSPVVVTDDVTVSLSGTLLATIDSFKNISCAGGADGAAYAQVSGGTPPVTYGWTDGNTSLTRTSLATGTYIFTASDGSNCFRSDTVVISQPAAMSVNVADVTQTSCSGNGAGVLTAVVTGGFAPYTYVWNSSPVQTDSILDNVPAGTYSVTVTSNGGCTASDNGTLTINSGGNNVTLNPPLITDVTCSGGSNGAITANATGGSGIFTYSWSNTQTGPSTTGLSAGNYTVSVNDGTGCTATATYSVTQPAPLIINPPLLTNIGCGGNVTGSITANVSGGTPNYGYAWTKQSNSQSLSGQTISGLTADSYSLTVTDANNCTASASFTISQVPPLLFTQSSADASCNGSADGSASVTITSGTAPYSYNWNGSGASSNSSYNTAAGVVNVTITDANCTVTATFNISEPTLVFISLINQTDILCNGGNNGTITISASGGTPGASGGYTYLWSNGQTTPTASGLSSGNVFITVTDGNNCTAAQTYYINEPINLTGNAVATNTLCYQSPDGSVNANPSGGTLPYSFLWTNGQVTQIATGLLAGSYSCTITDNNGCTASINAVVNEPADIILSGTTTQVKCIGAQNGTITPFAIGGTPTYTFVALQNGNTYPENNGIISNLGYGIYSLQVTDLNGCVRTVPITVPDASPDVFVTSTDSTSCYGSSYTDGAAHIFGTSILNGPYQFSIDGGGLQYSGDFFNLQAGAHSIQAINYFGCISSVPVIVSEPLPILVSISPDSLILPLGEAGQVLVSYLNATNVSYLWTPIEGLSCGDCPNPLVSTYTRSDYTVTVSMINGSSVCYGSANLHVEVLPQKPVYIPNTFSPNGDGNNDVFLIYGEDIKTVDLKIFNRWGELVYKTNNAFAGWDGTYKGELQLPQVFTYTAKITYLNDKKVDKSGSLTLLR